MTNIVVAQSARRPAFTLLEMTVALTIAGLLMAIAVPRIASLRDASAVRSAMTDLGAAFATARQTATARRAVVAVVIDTVAGGVIIRSAGQVVVTRPLRALYGVTVATDRDSAVYDPKGVGYGLSNLSVVVRRGSFMDTLTMSRLGRVRW